MRNKIIIGNWKMNKTKKEVEAFFNDLNQKQFEVRENTIYGLAIPFINIPVAQGLKKGNLVLSSQDISNKKSGAFTGEVSPSMLNEFDVKYAVIGHSERRMYHNETNQVVNEKAINALENKIVPVVCVGETLDEYENNQSKDVVKKQVIESLKGINVDNVVVAYEPVWAIGTGKTATFEYAQEMCAFIRSLTSNKTLIQYGGSVNGDNIDKLLEQNDIDGALVGGASLEVDSFIKLVAKNK